MKAIKRNIICIIGILMVTSCSLDNYDSPDSSIYGSFLDYETGELVEQDIIRGTQIEYLEAGYTTQQYMIVKNDGTYRNDLMFANEYEITPVRGNFEPLEPQKVKVAGETKLDFIVKPYLRIKDVHIFKNGDKVKAQFKIQQTGYDNVAKVGLYMSPEATVGATVNSGAVEVPVGTRVDETTTFTLEMDISGLKKGDLYFFRVGGVIDVAEVKFNYAKTVTLTM